MNEIKIKCPTCGKVLRLKDVPNINAAFFTCPVCKEKHIVGKCQRYVEQPKPIASSGDETQYGGGFVQQSGGDETRIGPQPQMVVEMKHEQPPLHALRSVYLWTIWVVHMRCV